MTQPKLSDAKLTMLAWLPLPPAGPRPPEAAQCIFSDGVRFWAGWWTGEAIMVNVGSANVTVQIADARRPFMRWAKLNNLVAIFDGVTA